MHEVATHDQCTGCSACSAVCPTRAITLEEDEWGFPRVQIDNETCIDCGACLKVCPAISFPVRKGKLGDEQFYAAYHRDAETRAASSSGGAFSALAESVLSEGGAVCAAALNTDTWSVHHIIIDSPEGLVKLRASKYMESIVGDCFMRIRDLLRSGRNVLFAGTPCQVAGLHLYLKKEYERLVTVDIVCHGVPSPRLFQDYIRHLESQEKSQVLDYTFRDKRWSWYHFNMKATFSSGSCYYGKWEEDPFYRGFLADLFLRESCYTCRYSKHERYADITLSDFWGYQSAKHKGERGFPNDDKGISMIMINTQRGETLYQHAKDKLIVCKRPREMSLQNGGFNPRKVNLCDRNAFLSSYITERFAGVINKKRFAPQAITFPYTLYYRFGRESWICRLADWSIQVCSRLKRGYLLLCSTFKRNQ